MGTEVDAPVFFTLLGLAFAFGIWIFFTQCDVHPARFMVLVWLGSAGVVAAMIYGAANASMAAGAGMFPGFIAPVWLLGGLIGLVAGMIWYRDF